jgi:alkylation response protein AidB-like acyl-CoA dehydrogenase
LGVSAFLVPKETLGLTVGEPIAKIGLETAPLSSIYLNECRVPRSHLVGLEGQGAFIFQASMIWERACLFAAWVGWMERLLDKTCGYARERRQFGQRIGDFQAISHRIVDMKVRLESARLLVYRACWTKDQRKDALLWIAAAKLAVSESAVQAALDAIRVFGGMGIVVDAGIETALRDAIPGLVYSGTSEMQKNIVAREMGL